MAALPLVMLAASAATSAYGAISSAQAQSASYKSQADAAKYNAAVEQQNATAAETAASANELAMRRNNNQTLGAQRARVAESGGGFSGTNINALNQSGANLELDALNTQYQGVMQARGLMAQSNLDQFQAQVASKNAKSAKRAGYISAAASVLGDTANYFNNRRIYNSGGG